MTRFIVAAALIAGFVAAPAHARAQQKETERLDRTIAFEPGGTLRLKNFSGDIRITGTPDRQVVIAAVRRATRERLDAVKLDIQTAGNEIAIDANRRESWWKSRNNNVVETEFDIKVPADTRLDIDAFSSPIHVTGVTARQRVKTFSGQITVRGAAGALDLHSFSGAVDLQLVDTTTAPELQVETFSGDITAEMPEASSGNVRFNSFSGGLKSDLPLTIESGDRRNLRGRLNNGGAEMRFKTFSGDVRLTRN